MFLYFDVSIQLFINCHQIFIPLSIINALYNIHVLRYTHIVPGDVDSSAPGVGPPCLLVEAFPSVGIKRTIVKPMQRDIQDTEREKNSVNDIGALETQWN